MNAMTTKQPARRHTGPPPGFLTRKGVAERLDVSSARLGKAGVLDLLDSWQSETPTGRPHGPRLFRQADVDEIAHWRFTRRGLIALGLLRHTSPGWPESLAAARNENSEDYYGADCPLCDRAAVYDPLHEEMGTWCPVHGVVPPGDYPPTPRRAALLALYDEEWGGGEEE